MKLPLFLLLVVSTIGPLHGASLTINEVFVRLQGALEKEEGLEGLVADLEDLDNRELQALLQEFDGTWRQLKSRYLTDHQAFLEQSRRGEAQRDAKAQIRKHRGEFMAVYVMGEGAMKPLLKSKSRPALEALRRLLLPTATELLESAPPELRTQRRLVLTLARFRDAIVDTAILPGEEEALAGLLAKEKEAIAARQDLPRDGLRILAENEEIAKKAKLPAEERQGIRELNEWRLLLGLNALVIDPKLCEASRGHSQDMKEHNFFAHQSPLPGKTTPWDRAAQAGTRSSGENIFMGSTQPEAANQGWFHSPGHHKNMFKASHTRIGLGRHHSHWTQMFG